MQGWQLLAATGFARHGVAHVLGPLEGAGYAARDVTGADVSAQLCVFKCTAVGQWTAGLLARKTRKARR